MRGGRQTGTASRQARTWAARRPHCRLQHSRQCWCTMPCIFHCSHATPDAGVVLPVPQRYDLFFSSTDGSGRRRRGRTLKPNVVLASYETVLRDRTLFNVSAVSMLRCSPVLRVTGAQQPALSEPRTTAPRCPISQPPSLFAHPVAAYVPRFSEMRPGMPPLCCRTSAGRPSSLTRRTA